MRLEVDRPRFDRALAEALTWPGVVAVDGWVNEGDLMVGDDIMKVVVADDIRENVFGGLQRLVGIIKSEVVTESEFYRAYAHDETRRPLHLDTRGKAYILSIC